MSTTDMATVARTVTDLEKQFWQSMVDEDTDVAVALLHEPSLMVSPHGVRTFDRATYRTMAEKGPMVLTSYKLSNVDVVCPNDTTAIVTYQVMQSMAPRGKHETKTVQEMNDTSTWIHTSGRWQCVMHTETPVQSEAA